MEIVITILGVFIVGFIIILYQVLKSKDDVELTMNVRKGEMSVKKKKSS